MMDAKQQIRQVVTEEKVALLDLSHRIHEHPELGFQEFKAVQWQIELLRQHGFSVTCPYCDMDTAYKAVFSGQPGGRRLAFLAEYDALRSVGHGCGHNIIATASVGAAIALSKVMSHIPGEIVVLGTPAEEGGGGKIIMVENHVFDDIDYAMMMHPSTQNLICRGGLASTAFCAEYFGKTAHSSSPDTGINALTAVINLFNAVDVLRQTWIEGAKISGIITDGGKASNVIPDHAAAEFTVRAKTRQYLLKMVEDLNRVAQTAGMMIGAECKISIDHAPYAERYPNHVMGEAFKANMATLGETMHYPDPNLSVGSSDIGNVSMVVPAIHEYLSIAPDTVNAHSAEFREAAISPRGDAVVLLAAQGLAMTAYDILTDTAMQKKIAQEFDTTVPR